MNKGMIMEIKKDYAIALNDSGLMEKISSKQGMSVGQKIFYFEEDIIKSTSRSNIHGSFIKTFGTMAALFLIVFTFFQCIPKENAYAVVSLDINPSIQIEANNKKKIVKVEGMNDDGKNIDFSEAIDKDLNDGIEKIKQILVEKKYLDTNKEVLVAFALVANNDDTQYEETVKGAIQSTFKTENITYVKGNKEAIAEAKTQRISLGRYEASLTVNEDIKKSIDTIPVKEITSSIKDKQNVIHWEAKEEKTDAGNKSEDDVKDQETTTKPAIEKPAQKPAITIPAEVAKPSKDLGTSEADKNKSTEDNGILEVAPETQTPPTQDVEVPEVPVVPEVPEKKPEDDNTIVNPDKGSIENKPTSGKEEENDKDKIKVKEDVEVVQNNK